MLIIPLKHTNILLGGQIKLDLHLQRTDNGWKVDNIKVSPLSEDIPYTYEDTSDILRSHEENIYNLYKEIGKNLFCNWDKFKTDNFLIDEAESNTIDTLTLQGMKRCKVKKYGAQFSYLLPVWFQDDSSTDKYQYNLVYNGNSLSIDMSLVDEYLKSYLTNINFLANYNLVNKIAWIYGLDVSDGVSKKVDVSHIIDNLLDRERPLIEQNYMIGAAWREHSLIVKNLINFNFVFSPEGAESKQLESSYKENDKVQYSVQITKNAEILENKDFLFNQSDLFMPYFKYKTEAETEDETESKAEKILSINDIYTYGPSMFSDTLENRDKDLIYKNKLNPFICHWTRSLEIPDLLNTHSGCCMLYDVLTEDGEEKTTTQFRTLTIPFKSTYQDNSPTKFMIAELDFVTCEEQNKKGEIEEILVPWTNIKNLVENLDKYNTIQYKTKSIFDLQKRTNKTVITPDDSFVYVYNNRISVNTNTDENNKPDKPYTISICICDKEKTGEKDTYTWVYNKKNNWLMFWIGLEDIYSFDLKKILTDDNIPAVFEPYFKSIEEQKRKVFTLYNINKSVEAQKSNSKADYYYHLYKIDKNLSIYREIGNIWPFIISDNQYYSKFYKNYNWKKISLNTSDKSELNDIVSSNYSKKLYPYLYTGLDRDGRVKPDDFISIQPADIEEVRPVPVLLNTFEYDIKTFGAMSESELKDLEDDKYIEIFEEQPSNTTNLLTYYDRSIDFDIEPYLDKETKELIYNYKIKYTLK